MKRLLKIFIIVSLFSLGFISCSKEERDPNASTLNGINIVLPSDNSSTFSLNPNNPNASAYTIKWSSADFGYSAAVSYAIQIDKVGGDFKSAQKILIPDTYNENSNSIHEYKVKTTDLNNRLFALSSSISSSSSFIMRVVGSPVGQVSTSTNGLYSYSQTISFSSNVYDSIDETPKIYVAGNFGSASTFADWNINSNGTSNSPLLYSPTKDGIYNGFIYMNVASPQFKFASPDDTSLNIKGVGTPYASDKIDLDANIAPGTLVSSTDISTGNVITPAVTTTAGTYYVYVDWTNNKYKIAKRLISLKGATTQNIVKYLNFVSDNTSPYYRMYVATNVTLSAGSGYIQVKDNSSGSADKLERFGIDNSNANLLVSTDAASSIKNKLKLGGQTQFNVNTPGTYTIVLDLRNSAIYNLRIIPN
jgi:hypothetical protein